MATNPMSSPLSEISGGEGRSVLPPSFSDPAPSSWEDQRRPLVSLTTERGGLVGGVASPDLPAEDSPDCLPSLPYWPFTPLPEASPAESDESIYLPDLPSWIPQPMPWNSSESFVEETPRIWSEEANPVLKKRKVEAGPISAPSTDEVAGADDADLELVEIAKLRGWEGPMDLDTLQLLKCLLPSFFCPPYVRSFLSLELAYADLRVCLVDLIGG